MDFGTYIIAPVNCLPNSHVWLVFALWAIRAFFEELNEGASFNEAKAHPKDGCAVRASRGVKCSPAVSLEISANLRIDLRPAERETPVRIEREISPRETA